MDLGYNVGSSSTDAKKINWSRILLISGVYGIALLIIIFIFVLHPKINDLGDELRDNVMFQESDRDSFTMSKYFGDVGSYNVQYLKSMSDDDKNKAKSTFNKAKKEVNNYFIIMVVLLIIFIIPNIFIIYYVLSEREISGFIRFLGVIMPIIILGVAIGWTNNLRIGVDGMKKMNLDEMMNDSK